jgi:hypothetical protein
MNGKILDTGYVIYNPKRDVYYTANTGIYITRKNAQKRVDKNVYFKDCRVVKVNLVVTDDD